MFQIALVQNQSEMAHYGYADARPLIAELGYGPVLFTAANINELGALLEQGHFDAIIFASNALNDKTIRTEILSESFKRQFHKWLSQGRGCLCLHQLRLSTLDNSSLGFLPEPFDELSAVVRPLEEKSAQGDLALGSRASDHILMLYPNKIDPVELRQNALQFRSLPGLYWHSWKNVNLSHWEILIEDSIPAEGPRPLVVSLREPNFRVVASALTLDWQRQRKFLQNILIYIVEGRHNTAILLDERRRNIAFDYLIGALKSRKFPFRCYFLGQDLSALEHHVANGVHTILVLGPFVELNRLSDNLLKVISKRMTSGYLKIVTLEERESQAPRFSVAGGEKEALRLLQTSELYIQDELRHDGYIDGSFWSTVETLQVIKSLPEAKGTYETLVDKALKMASEHDRDGSYDEVFGVTCALLWFRGTFLGTEAIETLSTANWIRKRIADYDNREQALAYLTLAELEMLTTREREALASLVTNLNPENLSEIDIVVYLCASLVASQIAAIPGFVSALQRRQQPSGVWVDLATTATAVTTLIDVLNVLRGSVLYDRVKQDIEQMVFKGIIHIQEALEQSRASSRNVKYPWEGKASTTIKCIQAWLKFDNLIDFPVYELVESMMRYDAQSIHLLSGRQALAVLEDLKQENTQLRMQVVNITNKLTNVRKQTQLTPILQVMIIVLTYLMITLLLAISISKGLPETLSTLKTAFIDAWIVHLTILSVVAAYLAIPWHRFLRRKKDVD